MAERMNELEWELAKTVCTPKQLAALDYWRRGFGWKRIGRTIGRDPATIRGHVEAGLRRLETALEERAA